MREPRDVVETTVELARRLRRRGVGASPDRVQAWVRALGALDPLSRADVYYSGRLTLCSSPDDLTAFDAAFAECFSPLPYDDAVAPPAAARTVVVADPAGDEPGPGDGEDGGGDDLEVPAASRLERLADEDLATLVPDAALLARLTGAWRVPGRLRRSARRRPAPRGRPDRPRTLRRVLASGGEVAQIARRSRQSRPRRLVFLVDVSGSMAPYGEAFLYLAQGATRRRPPATEVFTIGTRLTRVTPLLGGPDPAEAVRRAMGAAVDRGGGTRLGDLVKAFLDGWGQRGLARGAVVAVLSDGWERGDPALLGEQMARLHRLAHLVVWGNPRKAQPGYEPLAAGMAAALPHVDAFVEGHSVNALLALAATMLGTAEPDGAHGGPAALTRESRAGAW